ncbi:hypothetical protein SAMN05518683_11472 [Salibacterium halotolerans]|uniref:Cysteine-rich VLP n=1 Tax=Salibacterium halotolerans TaxID=1884432 RepID=A0A1I5UX19_9BACI|nr:hypothetical protein SAMN05518683_11472 [Salibacterium halotolerans]
MSLREDLKRQASEQCATYAGDGNCLLDRPCVFFDKSSDEIKRCPYFENCVLPADETLEARYWRSTGTGEDLPDCRKCGEPFHPKSNAQKYCGDCRAETQKEQARKRQRELRRNKRATT